MVARVGRPRLVLHGQPGHPQLALHRQHEGPLRRPAPPARPAAHVMPPSEYGVGGGAAADLRCPAPSAGAAAASPYWGVAGRYAAGRDPWAAPGNRAFLRRFYNTTIDFAAAGGGPNYRVRGPVMQGRRLCASARMCACSAARRRTLRRRRRRAAPPTARAVAPPPPCCAARSAPSSFGPSYLMTSPACTTSRRHPRGVTGMTSSSRRYKRTTHAYVPRPAWRSRQRRRRQLRRRKRAQLRRCPRGLKGRAWRRRRRRKGLREHLRVVPLARPRRADATGHCSRSSSSSRRRHWQALPHVATPRPRTARIRPRRGRRHRCHRRPSRRGGAGWGLADGRPGLSRWRPPQRTLRGALCTRLPRDRLRAAP